MSDIWRLSVSDSFAAAHALRHYEGKCENPHGHNFGVEICVEGSELDGSTEILLDFKILKNLLKDVLEKLDHQDLNAVPPFDKHNPSSENLAKHIWNEMEKGLACCSDSQAKKIWLVSVKVSEKPGQAATYLGNKHILEQATL